MAKARKGTVAEAMALQEQNEVQEKFQGAWFHSSKDKQTDLIAQEDPTFFSRSPHGWTGWGGHKANDPVIVAYVVESPSENTVLRPPMVKGGDADAFENGEALPDWWLILANEDIEKVMIVDRYSQSEKNAVKAYTDTAEYGALRKNSVDRAIDAVAKWKAMIEQSKGHKKEK